MAVAQSAVQRRQTKACTIETLQNQAVVIDGFNLLILLEGALSGAYLFKGMDGVYRDIACLLYTSPSPRDQRGSRMPSSA